jgi:hypothetical protein
VKTKKFKPAKKDGRARLVAAARDFVLDAYDTAVGLLTRKEKLALIATLRDDLDLRQSEITQKPGELCVRNQGDRTIITLAGVHKMAEQPNRETADRQERRRLRQRGVS